MLRTTTTRTARLAFSAPSRTPAVFASSSRGIASTVAVRGEAEKSPGEGVGKKEPITATGPITARVAGVGKAVKGVAEGLVGATQSKDGDKDGANIAGMDSRDQLHKEIDKGKKEGLKPKSGAQGGEQ